MPFSVDEKIRMLDEIPQRVFDEGNYEGMSVDMDTIKFAIVEMDKRLEMLEGKPPSYLSKKDLMRK